MNAWTCLLIVSIKKMGRINMRDMNSYQQSFYDIQVNGFDKHGDVDDFKALARPTIDELRAIEDARARDELVSTVYKLLNDISGKFIVEKMGFSNPNNELPSDQIIQAFKDNLIDFKNHITTTKPMDLSKHFAEIDDRKAKYKLMIRGLTNVA